MKVDVHVGLTFHMGPTQSNQYGRLDISLGEIDPEADVPTQISAGVGAARKAFEACVGELDVQVEAVLGGRAAGRR